jgi:hypothetical protein
MESEVRLLGSELTLAQKCLLHMAFVRDCHLTEQEARNRSQEE